MSEISVERNARVFIAGQTESGKTFLAHELCASLPRLVVIDHKRNPEFKKSFNLESATRALWRHFAAGKPARLQIPINPLELDDPQAYLEDIFRKVYIIGNCVLYIDELGSATFGSQYPSPYLSEIYRVGREPILDRKGRIDRGNIGVIACSQRPSNIPVFCMSESKHFFVFRLNNPDDRDKVAAYTTPEIRMVTPDPHGFYYYKNGMENAEYHEKLG